MFAKSGRVALVIALVLLIGGQWALLQSVAWIGMTIKNSQELPLTRALVKTFDGKHPCCLCKFVEQGKKSENKQETQNPNSKLDLFFVSSLIEFKFLAFAKVPLSSDLWTVRPETPPTPPPLPA